MVTTTSSSTPYARAVAARHVGPAVRVDEVREGERETLLRRIDRARVARAEQPDFRRRRPRRHRAHVLERMLARQSIVQPSDDVGDLLRKLLDVTHAAGGEGPRSALIAARRAPDPEVDAAGEERFQHAELLGDL